jgi:large subunit ribosomal protein L9
MKLLLKKDVESLGIVGDVVNVKPGYARNYLLPQDLATEPTDSNMKMLAEERKKAEARRAAIRSRRVELAEKLDNVEVTITAAANEDGVLYGSVGPREIASALRDEGYEIEAKCITLHTPLRRLDNVMVDIKLADDIAASVKGGVVRAKSAEELDEDSEEASDRDDSAGMEAGEHDKVGESE